MWKRSIHALLDVVLPPTCCACGGPGGGSPAGLCRPCRAGLPPPVPRCPTCGRASGPHRVGPGCARCTGPVAVRDDLRRTRRRAIHRVVVGQGYVGTARDVVLALKFRKRLAAADVLAGPMIEALVRAGVPGDMLVPVPLSARRRRRRGFNQSLALARPIARALSLPIEAGCLRRVRHDAPQSGRQHTARRRAPRGAFTARSSLLEGRCPVLVDDVLTTGATVKACALALRRAGAAAVSVVVACRADST